MKVLAYVEPSGRAVLELPPRPAGEWVEVEVREPETAATEDDGWWASFARRKEARRLARPASVRSEERIRRDLEHERTTWDREP